MRVLVIILILSCSSSLFAQWTHLTFPVYVGEQSPYCVHGKYLTVGFQTALEGFERTSDEGDSWTHIGNGFAQTDNILSVYENDPAMVAYIGDPNMDSGVTGLYISYDKGTTWHKSAETVFPVGAEYVHQFVFFNRKLYANTADALYESTDNGETWYRYTGDLPKLDPNGQFGMGIFRADNSRVSILNDSGIYVTDDSMKSWKYMGPAGALMFQDFAFVNGYYFALWASDLQRRNSDGSWSDVPLMKLFHTVDWIASGGGKLFASTGQEFLWCSSDSGITWTNVTDNMVGFTVGAIVDSENIFITAENGVWRRPLSSFSSVKSSNTLAGNDITVYPNPTLGLTTIQYQLPTPTAVSFRFYDVLGNTIQTIPPQPEPQGLNQITFDGSMLAAGVYYFTMTTGQGEYHGKIEVAK